MHYFFAYVYWTESRYIMIWCCKKYDVRRSQHTLKTNFMALLVYHGYFTFGTQACLLWNEAILRSYKRKLRRNSDLGGKHFRLYFGLSSHFSLDSVHIFSRLSSVELKLFWVIYDEYYWIIGVACQQGSYYIWAAFSGW